MIKPFMQGLRAYKHAHHLVWKEGMWKHLIVPGLLSMLYFPLFVGGLFGGAFFSVQELSTYISEKWLPNEVANGVAWGLSIIVGLLAIYLAFLLYRSVVMIIYAPFIGVISETAEEKFHGTKGPGFSIGGLIYDLYRSSMVSIIMLVISLMLTVVCWLLWLLPIVGAAIYFMGMLVVQAFFAGAGFMDPVLERRRLGIRASLSHSNRHKWHAMGNGAGFVLMMFIPIVGWFLAPSYGIIAAAVSGVDTLYDGKTLRR
ncbi:EI24 domain-containing protein [Pelagicoccus sp. NFK12]|uniref:EI24 domain-containing protein n=1 Tax=Pelagicoccus enzymogenes TaxID=2773457 RepID=A0A927F8M7_9BACT|nr:EI24 domain-containing protein [Pelagicoccus enzymogenes]MBD5780354.1 EI24 domain-containing protein [Pelagicoccus enzymogenes]